VALISQNIVQPAIIISLNLDKETSHWVASIDNVPDGEYDLIIESAK